jgi:SpoU rRNA methylase family enzyme
MSEKVQDVSLEKPTIRTEPALLTISDDSLITEAMARPEKTIGDLGLEADTLLNTAGIATTINGEPVIATEEAAPIMLGKDRVYARLARHAGKKNIPDGRASIVFCTKPEFTDMATPNGYFSPLVFASAGGDAVSVVAGRNTYAVNEDEHIHIASTILDDLTAKHNEKLESNHQAILQQEAEIAAAKAEQKARRHRRAMRTRNIGALVTLTGVALYGPQALDYGHIDAKIGAVPMPDVAEWFVDWNNIPDHEAQGLPKPVGALAIQAGAPVTNVPDLPSYNTSHVPRATNVHKTGSPDQSKPGLYKSTFNFDSIGAGKDEPDNCYDISGDFSPNKTTIFTQSPNFNRAVKVIIKNSKTLEVCGADIPENYNYTGSLFVYQNH